MRTEVTGVVGNSMLLIVKGWSTLSLTIGQSLNGSGQKKASNHTPGLYYLMITSFRVKEALPAIILHK